MPGVERGVQTVTPAGGSAGGWKPAPRQAWPPGRGLDAAGSGRAGRLFGKRLRGAPVVEAGRLRTGPAPGTDGNRAGSPAAGNAACLCCHRASLARTSRSIREGQLLKRSPTQRGGPGADRGGGQGEEGAPSSSAERPASAGPSGPRVPLPGRSRTHLKTFCRFLYPPPPGGSVVRFRLFS